MRAFLSHSSVDKAIVIAVHGALEKEAAWLDRAEIEWGDQFLEKIAEGIKSATDFILFWSAAASKSEWVRLEINMAFIQALRQKAIRLRVVVLDKTPLPLHLQPYKALSVVNSPEPARGVLRSLLPLLREPMRSARARFVNRHNEIARIETAVDAPEIFAIWLFGFIGIGKTSLVLEAARRIFEAVDLVTVDVTPGTGFVELALTLKASARHESLPESLPQDQIEQQIRLSIETLAKDERLLLVSNTQYWLNEDGEPEGPLPFLMNIVKQVPSFSRRPVFFTSTRRPRIDASVSSWVELQPVKGLEIAHIASLVRSWYYYIHGKELAIEDADAIAASLFGHPVAARLVAGLLGDHSVDYLVRYPRELVTLRRDLAKVLLQDLKLGEDAERLMEILALAGVALPASTIAGTGFSDEEFQHAIEQCARAGLVMADVRIEAHPLFRDFFWHRLHRTDYQRLSAQLANVLRKYLSTLDKESPEYAELLPVTFRLFALSGDLATATALRRDLLGELEAAAVNLYNRRNYALADRYIDHVLQANPHNWRLRFYRARIRIRQEEWAHADSILSEMLRERPGDVGVLHAKGWMRLRQNKLQEALDIFAGIISKREHVASLRDTAECLHRMHRNEEALKFLTRAKSVESENPFVLDLESRILEDMNQLGPAYEAALLASARDPLNALLHHRLGQIRIKQSQPLLAIPHFKKAVELDSDQFHPANSLASAYLDIGEPDAAEELLPNLQLKARTPLNRALVEHAKARIAFTRKNFGESEKILKREIAGGRNLIHNLGLLTMVEIALFDENASQFPTLADVALNSAEQALAEIVDLDPTNKFIEKLRAHISERRAGS